MNNQRILSGLSYSDNLDDLLAFLGDTYVEVSGQAEALRTVVLDLQTSLAYLHSKERSSTSVNRGELNSTVCRPGPLEHGTFQQSHPVPAAHACSPTHAPLTQPVGQRVAPGNSSQAHTKACPQNIRSLSAGPSRFGRSPAVLHRANPTPTAYMRRESASAAAEQQDVGIISREYLDNLCHPHLSPPAPIPSQPPPPAADLGTNSTAGTISFSPTPPVSHAPSRPALNISFKHALARHQAVLRAGYGLYLGDHCLRPSHQQQQYQLEGDGSWDRLGMMCSEDAVLHGAIGTVTDAADCFTSELAQYYGSSRTASSGAAAGNTVNAGPTSGSATSSSHLANNQQAASTHDVDVTSVALVAAHTWLIQALSKTVKPSNSSGASSSSMPSPAHVLQLLHSLPQLQVQLAAQQAQLKLSSTLDQDDSAALNHDVASKSIPEMAAAAAAQWRNRFLRAAMMSSNKGASDPAQLGLLAELAVPRPLGLWLPDACFAPLVCAELGGSLSSSLRSPIAHHAASSTWAALLSEVPWLLALPAATACAVVGSSLAESAGVPIVPQTSSLGSTSPLARVAHARGQMQLQVHLMHAWIESQLAAQLLPDPAYVQCCVQQAEQQQGLKGEQRKDSVVLARMPPEELTRALAAWRLSHTFLCKNSWNKCSYVALCQTD